MSIVIIFEQIQFQPSYNKYSNRSAIANIVNNRHNNIPEKCTIFYYVSDVPQSYYKIQLDAMWAGLNSHKYTINGYSAWNPFYFTGLYKAVALNADEQMNLKELYIEWISKYSIPLDRSCFVYGTQQ